MGMVKNRLLMALLPLLSKRKTPFTRIRIYRKQIAFDQSWPLVIFKMIMIVQ